jgi:hypothetical protein
MIPNREFDEELIRRMPLPLAQLYRRADNAPSGIGRHLMAFHLWEAAIKLLGSVALVQYAQQPNPDTNLIERLQQSLVRPSLGHWWELARRMVPLLAESGHEGIVRVRELLLGKRRDDLPFAAALITALTEVLDEKIRVRGAPAHSSRRALRSVNSLPKPRSGPRCCASTSGRVLRTDGTSIALGGSRGAGAFGRVSWPKVVAHR